MNKIVETYRNHRLELTERDMFWDVDVFYGRSTSNLYACVSAAKSASFDESAALDCARAVVDEKIYDDTNRLAMRAASEGTRQ